MLSSSLNFKLHYQLCVTHCTEKPKDNPLKHFIKILSIEEKALKKKALTKKPWQVSFVLRPVADVIEYRERAAALPSSGERCLCLLSCVGDWPVTILALSTAVILACFVWSAPSEGRRLYEDIFNIPVFFLHFTGFKYLVWGI